MNQSSMFMIAGMGFLAIAAGMGLFLVQSETGSKDAGGTPGSGTKESGGKDGHQEGERNAPYFVDYSKQDMRFEVFDRIKDHDHAGGCPVITSYWDRPDEGEIKSVEHNRRMRRETMQCENWVDYQRREYYEFWKEVDRDVYMEDGELKRPEKRVSLILTLRDRNVHGN